MEPVRGHRNAIVVNAARLHRPRARAETGQTLIEGPHLLAMALARGIIPDAVFSLEGDRVSAEICEKNSIEVYRVNESALERIAGTKSPRGPIAVISIPEGAGLDSDRLIVSWGVSDPGNVGTMIRTAAAFGWGFGYTSGTADPWSPKVLRSGAGGHFMAGVRKIVGLDEISRAGYRTVASVVEGGIAPTGIRHDRIALLIGEEARGLPKPIISACQHRVTIPMAGGMESLNAAVAAAILVYGISNSTQ